MQISCGCWKLSQLTPTWHALKTTLQALVNWACVLDGLIGVVCVYVFDLIWFSFNFNWLNMVRHLSVSQQKIAEKLTILNDRGIGMLTRLYNIKKVCYCVSVIGKNVWWIKWIVSLRFDGMWLILNFLYHCFLSMLQQSSDPKSRPSILSDKSLESAMKQIVRRFPHSDTRSNNVSDLFKVMVWLSLLSSINYGLYSAHLTGSLLIFISSESYWCCDHK